MGLKLSPIEVYIQQDDYARMKLQNRVVGRRLHEVQLATASENEIRNARRDYSGHRTLYTLTTIIPMTVCGSVEPADELFPRLLS